MCYRQVLCNQVYLYIHVNIVRQRTFRSWSLPVLLLTECFLQQVYEDDTHVYLVMELCKGPGLEHESTSRPHSEGEVASYVRSIVQTIAQCQDKGLTHGAVALSKFRFLGLERNAPLKAVSFQGNAALASSSVFETLSHIAPEELDASPSGLGNEGDMWAAGLVAAKLLTAYFPFDDILGNMVRFILRSSVNVPVCSALLKECLRFHADRRFVFCCVNYHTASVFLTATPQNTPV